MIKRALLLMSAAALLAAPAYSAGFTLEWDSPDPSFGDLPPLLAAG